MPVVVLQSEDDLRRLRAVVTLAAEATLAALRELCDDDPLKALARIKFTEFGRHPLEDRPLNLIEQINQTFTYLASFAAVEEISRRHKGPWPIQLNLGTAPGSDVTSLSAGVAAEVFAAVHPTSNDKLASDIAKVEATPAQHKYVFFFCPGIECPTLGTACVQVVPLRNEQVLGTDPLTNRSSGGAPRAAHRKARRASR